jgi:signal transduction histidine kinase
MKHANALDVEMDGTKTGDSTESGRETFERHADEIVDTVFEHLKGFDPIKPFLADSGTVRRLKQVQRDYLVSLTSGELGENHARQLLNIGRVHDRIGLDPEWFIGTYGLFLELLRPRVQARYATDGPRALRAMSALAKLLILDVELVQDAYHEARRRREVRQSEELAAVGELAASIAHEVRNPLAGMKGALDVLRAELAVKPSNLEIVDELVAQIERLEQLVRDLLTYARPSTVNRHPFDLQEMLDRLLKLYKDQTDASGITVRRAYGPGTSEIVADLPQMEQVFLNLIHNAVQAMEDGGTLTVSTFVEEADLVVSFEDTGKGIPEAELKRIFQPFFTTKHRGSGLGLPIVKKIVTAHEGTIEVNSRPGEGTTVRISLTQPRGD